MALELVSRGAWHGIDRHKKKAVRCRAELPGGSKPLQMPRTPRGCRLAWTINLLQSRMLKQTSSMGRE